jgi:hypothetical protein
MVGTFVLAGGNEFQGICDDADRTLLTMMPDKIRQIVIVPSATTEDDATATIASGVRHFRALAPHASVEGALVLDAKSANDTALAARIASASLVFLCGTDPLHLVRALRGSEVLAAIAAVATRGGVVAGSNAGAIALCETMRYGNGWQPGLGFVPGVAVLPLHDATPASPETIRAGLPDATVVLGIPAGVNCVAHNDPGADDDTTTWLVLGERPLTIYRPTGAIQICAGQTFTLGTA